MSWLRQRRKIILTTAGILFLVFGGGLFSFWHLWMLAQSRRIDPQWVYSHSREEFWRVAQEDIPRYGWMHDDGFTVGNWGDENWANWIIDQAEEGKNIAGCMNGHLDSALKHITCQSPHSGHDDSTSRYWIEWRKTNKDKSQIEWIRDGLAKYGVTVHIPPSKDDFGPLLLLLGDETKKTNADGSEEDVMPNFVKYNAFRWLRDSDFEPVAFALTLDANAKKEIYKPGLIEYAKRYERAPRRDNLGILPFKPIEKYDLEKYRSRYLVFRLERPVNCVIGLALFVGVGFLFLARRSGRNRA